VDTKEEGGKFGAHLCFCGIFMGRGSVLCFGRSCFFLALVCSWEKGAQYCSGASVRLSSGARAHHGRGRNLFTKIRLMFQVF